MAYPHSWREARIPHVLRASQPVTFHAFREHFKAKQLQRSARKFPVTQLHSEPAEKLANVTDLLRQPHSLPRFPSLPVLPKGKVGMHK